ncbi:MAG TPA: tripartite tricarboxylate transporter substrate binding protein [Burkholderiales bacterium]|jgi:tripartite-type tricarboxylate transporter receptor subunit TctC
MGLRRAVITCCLAGGFGLAAPALSLAQAYPDKPIRFITGPGPDTVARVLGQKMSQAMGQPVVVDQRGGGGGIISAEVVAKSPPDGYTLLLATGTHTINPIFYKLSYDVEKDFAPVTLAAAMPFVLTVNPKIPVNSVAELVQYAKARPGRLNFGSGGNASPPQLSGELFKSMAGINIVHVPYKTTAAAVMDVVGGQLQMMFAVGALGIPQVKAGRLRGLAVTTPKRSPALPELPTMIESGYPGFEVLGWNGVLVPARTPPSIIQRLHDEIVKALQLPDVRETLAAAGLETIGDTPEEFAAFMKTETARWTRVARQSGATVDK